MARLYIEQATRHVRAQRVVESIFKIRVRKTDGRGYSYFHLYMCVFVYVFIYLCHASWRTENDTDLKFDTRTPLDLI